MDDFLFQAAIYLFSAVALVPLTRRFGFGSVLGYLFAGILIGPVLGLVGTETSDVQHFAEFGVVMMLFVIGLELEPRALWDMRARLVGLGGLQIGLTAFAIGALCQILGLSAALSVALGLTFALSSTAIVLQTIEEKGLIQSPGGRSAFSVLLAQDIAVIPILALLPLLGGGSGGSAAGAHGEGPVRLALIDDLPGWSITLITIAAVVAVVVGGRYLSGPLFRFASSARAREVTTATALLMVIGIALMMNSVGLSPALGTFLAGVVLANSEFRHQIEADIEPFKGLLLGLFFITVGAGIDLAVLWENLGVVLTATLALIAVKFAILLPLGRIFALRGRDQWLFALGLAQAGGFCFVLLSFMSQTHVIPTDLEPILFLIVGLSMLLTPALFILHEKLADRFADVEKIAHDEDVTHTGPVLVAGVGRFGQVINRLVHSAGFETTLLDSNYQTIRSLRALGQKCYFGDPTRIDLLRSAGLDQAHVLVIAVDDTRAALKITRQARRERPDIHIVARAADRTAVYELYQAGANDIVRETFDGSVRAGRYVLERMGLNDFEAGRAAETFTRIDRAALKDLALLWRPGVPMEDNPGYMRRIRALNADLSTALLASEAPETDQAAETQITEEEAEVEAETRDAAE